jgi:hypothetical protein
VAVVSTVDPGGLCGCRDCPGPDDLCADCATSTASGHMVSGGCGGKCTEDARYAVTIVTVGSRDPVEIFVCDHHKVGVGAFVLESLFPPPVEDVRPAPGEPRGRFKSHRYRH